MEPRSSLGSTYIAASCDGIANCMQSNTVERQKVDSHLLNMLYTACNLYGHTTREPTFCSICMVLYTACTVHVVKLEAYVHAGLIPSIAVLHTENTAL